MTREEAIEVLRNDVCNSLHVYDITLPTIIEALKTLIPELRESDSDRVRQALCDIVRDMPYMETELRAHGLTVEQTLAYLEKKKEPTTEELYAEVGTTEKEYIANTMKMVRAMRERKKERKPILEVFGFKVGDAVRLKDGDGRKHIIKSFEEVEGIHGPNFYHVEFEDNSARDGIYPGEEYPNGYYTQMEKFEEEQKPISFYEPYTPDDYEAVMEGNATSIRRKQQEPVEEPRKFKLGDKVHWHDDDTNVITITGFRDDAYLTDSAYGPILFRDEDNWERIEQEFAEWSDTDNIGWDEAFACVTRAEKVAKNEEELQNAVTAEKWLKEIKFKYCVHPMKEEWSEEDDKMVEKIICSIWNCETFTRKDKVAMENFMISLRPSWKPSEEQMDVLNKMTLGGFLGSGQYDILRTLYEDLKKLI